MENQQSKMYLISIVVVAILGGLLFGYDTAVISGAEKGLQAFFLGATDFVYTDAMHGFTRVSNEIHILQTPVSDRIAETVPSRNRE